VVTGNGLTVEIRRPEGSIQLALPGGNVFAGGPNFGDLNGDGRSDYVVATNAYDVYVVNGRLSPGVKDVRKVGLRLRGIMLNRLGDTPRAVGDQDDDGADELALGDRLYSGRALLARGRGRTIALPRPFRIVDHLAGALVLAPDVPPTLVQQFGGITESPSVPNDPVELRINRKQVDCLVTGAPVPDLSAESESSGQFNGRLDAWLVDGHRVVELNRGGRGYYAIYRWDLDA
jgi:hypothetical protein